jgi:hypothetical protein
MVSSGSENGFSCVAWRACPALPSAPLSGAFLWKTYRYGDEPPPPWLARDRFLVLLVVRAAELTSRRRLMHPPNGIASSVHQTVGDVERTDNADLPVFCPTR